MVVNGACKHKDMEHFQKYISGDVRMEYLGEQQLVALQVGMEQKITYYCVLIYLFVYSDIILMIGERCERRFIPISSKHLLEFDGFYDQHLRYCWRYEVRMHCTQKDSHSIMIFFM